MTTEKAKKYKEVKKAKKYEEVKFLFSTPDGEFVDKQIGTVIVRPGAMVIEVADGKEAWFLIIGKLSENFSLGTIRRQGQIYRKSKRSRLILEKFSSLVDKRSLVVGRKMVKSTIHVLAAAKLCFVFGR